MVPPDTLQKLIDMARRRSDLAARSLGASHTREREEESKLQLLIEYRLDYLRRYQHTARYSGLNANQLANYQDFLRKLDTAIEQQQAVVMQSHSKVEHDRGDWRAANRKEKSFDTLSRRNEEEERVRANRREQREQDDLVLARIISGN